MSTIRDEVLAANAAYAKSFGDKALDADWAVVYYAGHGVQIDGRNYLVPVDVRLQSGANPVEAIKWHLIAKAGGKVLGEPMDIPGIGRDVSFYDTEGNRVSILQPLPRSSGRS